MRRNTSDSVKAFLACALIFVVVVAYMYLKIDAYNGDVSCLFVHCVKVIH